MAGTIEMKTKRLTLRRYRPEDAGPLHQMFGIDPAMYQYSGWNPYATIEMTEESVRRCIEGYADCHSYGWAIEAKDRLVGTIGAYDYSPERNSIEVGLSIARDCWGLGYATEALKTVLSYLTGDEGIATVTGWCASENAGSARAMEKAGMERTGVETGSLTVRNRTFDKLLFQYDCKSGPPLEITGNP